MYFIGISHQRFQEKVQKEVAGILVLGLYILLVPNSLCITLSEVFKCAVDGPVRCSWELTQPYKPVFLLFPEGVPHQKPTEWTDRIEPAIPPVPNSPSLS